VKNRRIQRAREPKVVEDEKTAMFVRGATSSLLINQVMSDLCDLKKPEIVKLQKSNKFRPFEDPSGLEFLSDKNDAGLFAFNSHSKKRPNNLIIGRMFDHHVLDMIELGVENFKSLGDFKIEKSSAGNRPLMIFVGEEFEHKEEYKKFSNVLLDFFHGVNEASVNLAGLEHAIVCTSSQDKIYLRGYRIFFKKSGTKTPHVELKEMGPFMDLTIRRSSFASPDLMKIATKFPKEITGTKVKNIGRNEFNKTGRIHMDRQDISELALRRMKGFKKRKADTDKPSETGTEVNGSSKKPRNDNLE